MITLLSSILLTVGITNIEALAVSDFKFRSAADVVDVGYFWHVADLHWDPTYRQSANYSGVSCGSTSNRSLGNYGDYACDSPWTLIDSAIGAMKQLRSNVDFLIWTGDDTPHNAVQTTAEVTSIISNLTDKLREHFPNQSIPIFSVFGNHDWSPKHQLTPRPNEMYDMVASMWSPRMMSFDAAADETFRKSGYYALWINQHLRILGLNTNLYYRSNNQTVNMPDPGNQMQWLDDILTETAQNGSKAILIGHVPPGVFEKHQNYSWYRPQYNKMFLSLMHKHKHVISSAYFAHHHTDTFRVIRDTDGNPASSLLIAPAVTPWETTLPGVMGGAGNNPCVRLVHYNRQTGETIDYEQYYLDLKQANSLPHDVTANWTLEYRFTDYFRVENVSTVALNDVAERLISDDETFARYYEINDARFEEDNGDGGSDVWTLVERQVHYCAATCADYDDYAECLRIQQQGTTNGTTIRTSTQIISGAINAVDRSLWKHILILVVSVLLVNLTR